MTVQHTDPTTFQERAKSPEEAAKEAEIRAQLKKLRAKADELKDDQITLATVGAVLSALNAYTTEDGDIVLSESGAFLFFNYEEPGKPGGSWKVRTR